MDMKKQYQKPETHTVVIGTYPLLNVASLPVIVESEQVVTSPEEVMARPVDLLDGF
jgi:hypothetical protein